MKGSINFARALAGAAVLAMAAPVLAQGGPPPAAGAAKPDVTKAMTGIKRATEYAALAKLPDLSGIWYPDWAALFGARGNQPQLTPAAKAKLDAYTAKYKEHGPPLYAQAACLPPGMPGIMGQPFPIDISYQPGRITIYAEAYEQPRWIYTDGRKLPDDPDPFFNGTSVGHWEGDTLVVETVGFSPETTIAPGIGHSDKMKIVERFYLVNPKLDDRRNDHHRPRGVGGALCHAPAVQARRPPAARVRLRREQPPQRQRERCEHRPQA